MKRTPTLPSDFNDIEKEDGSSLSNIKKKRNIYTQEEKSINWKVNTLTERSSKQLGQQKIILKDGKKNLRKKKSIEREVDN